MPTPVKDIVSKFESKASPTGSIPSPTPARFLRHPARRESAPVPGPAGRLKGGDLFNNVESARDFTEGRNSVDFGKDTTSLSLGRDHNLVARTTGATRRDSKLFKDGFGQELAIPGERPSSSSPATVPKSRKEPLNWQPLSPSSTRSSQETFGTIIEHAKARPSHRQSLPSTNFRTNLSQSVYSSVPSYDFYDHESTSATTIVPTSPFTPLSKTSTTDIPLMERSQKDKTEPPAQATPIRHFKHKPIPAKDVFARKAGPLYLPHLDAVLSKISPPEFDPHSLVSPLTNKGKDKGKGKASSTDEDAMFPPLQKLQGKTIEELQHNSGLLPFYADQNFILNSVITTFIGVLVCI
jgi:hypothetical protein